MEKLLHDPLVDRRVEIVDERHQQFHQQNDKELPDRLSALPQIDQEKVVNSQTDDRSRTESFPKLNVVPKLTR